MSLRVLDSAVRKLHIDSQTRDEAKKIFLKASQCTKPGSGHQFSYGPDALAAICVLLASNKLGNNAVTKEQARVSAALEPNRFENAHTVVKRALSSSEVIKSEDAITFKTLIQRYDVCEDHVVPMVEVRDYLERHRRADPTIRVIQCVIFYWVRSEIFKMDTPTKETIQQDFLISPGNWKTSWNIVETQCAELKKQQIKHAEDNASHRRTRSQTANNRSQPFNFAVKLQVTPNRTESVQKMKRKAPLDDSPRESPSPLKRLKGAPLLPSGGAESPEIQTKGKYNVSQKNSVTPRMKVIPGDGESGDEMPKEAIVVTSMQPVRKVTRYTAWEAARPIAFGEESPRKPIESLLQKTPSMETRLHNSTPATSTGMSEMSSPTSPPTPNVLLKKTSMRPGQSIQTKLAAVFFKEPSRRQRRNLRAPFLDPGVYAWRPDVFTAYKMKQAQKWEALIISNYGDPWDDL